MKENHQLIYSLRFWMLVVLILIYFSYLVSGIAVVFWSLVDEGTNFSLMQKTLITSFACCLYTCGMQYIKRLYKACIQERICIKERVDDKSTKYFGNFIYFIFRPVFAIVFVLIAIIALKAGIILVTVQDSLVMNERFFYISVLMAAGIGFSVGKVLDNFEIFMSLNCQVKCNDTEK